MKYLGAKGMAGVKQRFVAAAPACDTYIELFLGTGVVLSAMERVPRMIGIESNATTLKRYSYPDYAEIIHGDAFEFLQTFDFHAAGRVFIYCDPPYVHSTRKMNSTYGEHELTDKEHKALCFLLCRLSEIHGVKIILSGYDNDIYRQHLKGFTRTDYQTMTQAGYVTESMWTNYDVGAEPLSHKFVGSNKSERQIAKRTRESWAGKYEDMSPAQRLNVMSGLIEVDVRASEQLNKTAAESGAV